MIDEAGEDIVLRFSRSDFRNVNEMLNDLMNDARARRIFTGFVRSIKNGDSTIDIAWAMAQMLNNLIHHEPDEDKRLVILRDIFTMALMMEARRRHGIMETRH